MTHHERYKETHRRAEARRRAKRQAAAGIFPIWKAAAVIQAAMDGGATFDEAYAALLDVLDARGLKIRAGSIR